MGRVAMSAVLLILAGASGAPGQDTDEVKRLRKEVEVLQSKLAAATQRAEKLQAENNQLRAAGGKKADKAARDDAFAPDSAFEGVRTFKELKLDQALYLRVTERDGTSFKGLLTIKGIDPVTKREIAGEDGRKVPVAGTAPAGKGGPVRFKTEKSGKFEQAFSGQFNNGVLGFSFSGAGQNGEAVSGTGQITAK